jgi:tetratricopeptide (TPR) repeat protein
MIRHQVYFDTLGSLREGTPSWRAVFAGLSVLRLVDSCGVAGSPAVAPNWAQLHSVRSAIEEMSEGDVVRGVLTGVLEAVTTANAVDDNVCAALMAYGRALDYEASWGLAIDVFSTVTKTVRPEKNARLAIEANVALGGAARRNAEWETSARAYSQAAFIADTLGDRVGVLTVQVGIANSYLARGNLPQAQTILDDTIVQAREHMLAEVQGIALHSRAAIAHIRGEYPEAIKLAYEAFNLTSDPGERDFVLADIAAGFSQLGMLDAARDAHLLLSVTSQAKRVRWQATINLLEIASLEGDEQSFELYDSELRRAPMGPWLRSHYLLLLGESLMRFGRIDAATETLENALEFASSNQIHKVAFQAESALRSVASTKADPTLSVTSSVSESYETAEVREIANSLSQLREAATAAS